jgi:hypothetical protein
LFVCSLRHGGGRNWRFGRPAVFDAQRAASFLGTDQRETGEGLARNHAAHTPAEKRFGPWPQACVCGRSLTIAERALRPMVRQRADLLVSHSVSPAVKEVQIGNQPMKGVMALSRPSIIPGPVCAFRYGTSQHIATIEFEEAQQCPLH